MVKIYIMFILYIIESGRWPSELSFFSLLTSIVGVRSHPEDHKDFFVEIYNI